MQLPSTRKVAAGTRVRMCFPNRFAKWLCFVVALACMLTSCKDAPEAWMMGKRASTWIAELHSKDDATVGKALDAIKQLGPDAPVAVHSLTTLLKSTRSDLHVNVYLALSAIGGKGVDELLAFIESKKGSERAISLMALAKAPYLEPPQAGRVARLLGESNDLLTRLAAADVVLAHDKTSKEPAIVYSAVLESNGTPERFVRHAIEQLGAMKDRASGAVHSIVQHIMKTDNLEVQRLGIEALRALEPATNKMLCSTLEASTSVVEIRNMAILLHALAKPKGEAASLYHEDADATKALLPHLDAADEGVRLNVCQALARIAAPSDALRKALRKRVHAKQSEALLAWFTLSRVTDKMAVDVLRGVPFLRSRDHVLESVAAAVAGFGMPGITLVGLELRATNDPVHKAYLLEILGAIVAIRKKQAHAVFRLTLPHLSNDSDLVREAAVSPFQKGVLPSLSEFETLLRIAREAETSKRSACMRALNHVLILCSPALDSSSLPELQRQRARLLAPILQQIKKHRPWLQKMATSRDSDTALAARFWLARIGESHPLREVLSGASFVDSNPASHAMAVLLLSDHAPDVSAPLVEALFLEKGRRSMPAFELLTRVVSRQSQSVAKVMAQHWHAVRVSPLAPSVAKALGKDVTIVAPRLKEDLAAGDQQALTALTILNECSGHATGLRKDVAGQLSSKHPQIVQMAANVLKRMGSAASDHVPSLWKAATTHFGGTVGDACAVALAHLGPKSISHAAHMALRPSWREYAMAMRVLQESGESARQAIPALIELAGHKESDRRALAAILLAKSSDDPRAASQIEKSLADAVPSVRLMTVRGLAQNAQLGDATRELLARIAQSDPMPHIREAAGKAATSAR